MGKSLLIAFLFIVIAAQGQNGQIFLSEALDQHLPKYLLEVENAIKDREQDQVREIFEKLVSDKLVGSYLDNVQAKNLSRKNKDIASYEKPVLLITNPAWRLNSKGEQPALNELARNYGDRVDIIILYWGEIKAVKKLSKNYHRSIDILYVDDNDNKHTKIIKSLKHSLGLPLAFSITSNKEIVEIKNRFSNRMSISLEKSSEQNYKLYEDMIRTLLSEEGKSYTVPTALLD